MHATMLSEKQREVLRLWQRGALRRINIFEGAVRSGKTWISALLWALWVCDGPKNAGYLMAAKTLATLKRNVLDPLRGLVGKNFTYSLSKKEAMLFGRRIYLEGAGDARAEPKLRGMTLYGAYLDELTLMPHEFFAMLLSRLSEPGAKLFATTNPDSPAHWLKQRYLDRAGELDLLALHFNLDDNPFLPREYVASLKREFSGMFYERYVLGRWVGAEGLVYPMFDAKKHVIAPCEVCGRYYISVDYGTANPCSMGLWCVGEDGTAVRVGEYYHDSRRENKILTDQEYYQALVDLAGGRDIDMVVVDPSAASFIETIRRHGRYRVRKAKNRVIDGIRTVSTLLCLGRLKFFSTCKNCIDEFYLYSWDDKAGQDKVIKEHDHAMDDTRYFCETVLRRKLKSQAIEGVT